MQHIIIDVREPKEYQLGHVEGAINIPPSELLQGTSKLKNTSKDTTLIIYCVSGSRSAIAKNMLNSMGYKNVINGINQDHVKSMLKSGYSGTHAN